MKAVKVLNLDSVPDGQGETFDPAGLTFPADGVPLVRKWSGELEDCIGWATLEKREDGLYAEIKSPFMLKGGYPSVAGILHEADGKTLKRVEIQAIMVSAAPNSDKRIEPIKED